MTATYSEWDGKPPPEPEAPFRRSWQPVDLSEFASGDYEPQQPSVGQRSDGVGMFYEGKVHTVSSESEAGKTWLMLSACVDELVAGQHVAYLDFEDDAGGLVRRLLALQVPVATVLERFHYVRPMDPVGEGIHLDDLRRVLVDYAPTLCVIDGVTEAMTMHGMDPLSNKDIAKFGRVLPRWAAELGPAVVCLDHVVKSSESRGRYALGGVHKLNALDGAAFVLENRKPFGVGLTGISTVRIAKDRPGQLRKHGLPGKDLLWFADLKLTSHEAGFLEVQVVAPEAETQKEFRPTWLMGEICRVLSEKGSLSRNQIEALVTGKATTIRAARSLLEVDGYISEGSPHSLLKPWDGGVE